MVFSKMENPVSSTYLHGSTNMSSCLHAVEVQVDTSCHDAKVHGRGDLHLDESVSASALGSGNETVKKPFLYEVSDANSENLDKLEFSPDTVPVSFQLNAEVLGSLSLHGDSCPEEILGDVCSQALFHHDGGLVKKHDLDIFSEDSSSLCCNMHLKGETHTWQRSSVLSEFSLCTLGGCHDNFIYCEHGGWRVIWDPFYKSNYFVNVKTLESTWYPPPGLDEYAFPCSDLSRKETDVDAAEKDTGSEHSCGFSVVTDSLLENEGDSHFTGEQPVKISAKMEAEIGFYSQYAIVGNGNSNVQLSLYPSNVTDDVKEKLQERTEYLSDSLVKYWRQRYSLFSRFDYGIKMDEESWFSVTPELIAKHHAVRCGSGTIIDCFTGVGGNAIQFAMRSNHVIAIDVDPQKIEYAQQNAVIYEVSERIDFIKGDFFEIAPSLKGDVVFLSPPWGGPDYAKMQAYDMSLLRPRDGYYLFKIASMIAAKVVMFLPRNVNLSQLVDLSMLADPPWNLEVENNYLNGKLKSITAYFDKTTRD
ncbi:trimethylguanosine synthase [Dendrobium catenatum]|uniref:Trimethylguanosine synthase n=1 Tax=Dendrobium catenatum TaxID=906689 RepID=A0A2I0W0E3_9ASPA|nr:trimethylguanosine synthase [Dendrobium catenatum]